MMSWKTKPGNPATVKKNPVCFSKTQLEDVILPLVLLGIRDSNDNLVGETLKALSVLVSVLGAEKVVGKRKKVFADGSPAKSKIDGFSVKSKVCKL